MSVKTKQTAASDRTDRNLSILTSFIFYYLKKGILHDSSWHKCTHIITEVIHVQCRMFDKHQEIQRKIKSSDFTTWFSYCYFQLFLPVHKFSKYVGGDSSVQVTVLATWGYFHKHEILSIILRLFLEWWEWRWNIQKLFFIISAVWGSNGMHFRM